MDKTVSRDCNLMLTGADIEDGMGINLHKNSKMVSVSMSTNNVNACTSIGSAKNIVKKV